MSRKYKFHNPEGVYPVEDGIVFRAEDYLYSSAVDYAGLQGLLEAIVIK